MQFSIEVLSDLPDSVLWKLARFLPDHETEDTAHQTFCLLGRSWRNAYCASRHAVTLHLGPGGLGGVASRVLEGSGGSATRLEVHVHGQAQVQLVAAALRSLPKLKVLILHGLDTASMVVLAPAVGALSGLRKLQLHDDIDECHGDVTALARALKRLTGLQHLRLSWGYLGGAGSLAPALQQLAGLLSLDLGSTVGGAAAGPFIRHFSSLQKLTLKVGSLAAEDTAVLAPALGQLGGLQELALHECIMDDSIGPLAPAIAGLTALRQLRFTGPKEELSKLDEEGMEALAHALAQCTGLQLLHLNNHGLGTFSNAVDAALASALRQLTGLTELDLNDKYLYVDVTHTLVPALGSLTGLVSLSIGHVPMNEEEEDEEMIMGTTAVLAPVLAVLTQLTRLHLRGQYVNAYRGDEAAGVVALAAAIGGLVRLRHLGIRSNDLGMYGTWSAAALAAPFQRLTQLQLLDLSQSYLDKEGAAALAPALQQLTGLQQLHLVSTNLGAGGMGALAPALPQMTSLRHLNLRDNYLRVAGAEVLAPTLAHMPGLQHLNLRDNYLYAAGAEVLAPALARMPGLQHLDLSTNDLGVQGVMALAPDLARMPGLQHLALSHNGLEDPSSCILQPDAGEDTVGVHDVAALAPALARLTNLTHLDLSYNDLGTRSMAALTPVLEQLTRLRHISLDH